MNADLIELLQDLSEYMEQREDADCGGDPARYIPNEEMQLNVRIQCLLAKLEQIEWQQQQIREMSAQLRDPAEANRAILQRAFHNDPKVEL